MEKRKILLVDDMEEVYEKLKTLRQKYEQKYDIDYAKSEKEALEMIEKNNYSGILTDYHLGEESPKGGLKIVRAAKRKGIHSILMSAENHKKEALESGADGFVFKKRLFDKYSQ